MKLSNIEVYLLRIPFKKPFRFADTLLEEFESVLVRMDDTEGRSGWGEVYPGNKPYLTAAWSTGVFHVLKDCVLPHLGTELVIDSGDDLAEKLTKIKGNRHAKAALDLAFWDLYSRRTSQPLYQAIGGKKRPIELGVVFDRYMEIDPFIDDLVKAVEQKFRRVTLKIRPGWDLQMLRIVRDTLAGVSLQCDVEGALSMEKHSEILYRFDDFMPTLLEQPLSAYEYVGHAMLQDALRTSIALDESITSLHQAEIAIDLRSADTFCIKPGRIGGMSEAKKIHDACASAEISCYAGCDCLSAIGYRSVLALSSLDRFTLPADYLDLDETLAATLGETLRPTIQEDENGQPRQVIELWDESGIGFEPDRELIEKLSIARFTWPGA